MDAKFALPQHRHDLEFAVSGKGIHHSVSFCPSNDLGTRTIMTMKHPRDNDGVNYSIVSLGSDHSNNKRQRTTSKTSESSDINAVANANINTSKTFGNNSTSENEVSTYRPRMTVLLSSLKALDYNKQRQILQQCSLDSTKTSPAISLHPSTSTIQAPTFLFQQKQRHLKMVQPLIKVPASQAKANTLSTTTIAQVESRDAVYQSPAVDTAAIDTINISMAAATAATTFENNATTYTSVKTTLGQHRMVVAVRSGVVFSHRPVITSSIIGTPNFPLSIFPIPKIPSTTARNTLTTMHNAAHLSHRYRSFPIQGSTARQLAVHDTIHSNYKKIYKPLQRPPRLPTPHEALGIAVISTPTPTTSACR